MAIALVTGGSRSIGRAMTPGIVWLLSDGESS